MLNPLLILLALAASEAQAAEEPLRFAVLPAVEARQMEKEYAPLVQELQKAMGRSVELVVPSDYADVLNGMVTREVNLALLSAYMYAGVQADLRDSVVVQWRRSDPQALRGKCIVKTASPYKSLADLAGKRVAYVHVGSTSGHLYPRLAMRKEGVDPQRHFAARLFGGSHDRVFDMVMQGEAELGCVSERSLVPKKGFRVLLTADTAPGEVLVAHTGVTAEERAALRAFFLDAAKNKRVAAFMKAQGIAAFVEPDLGVYAPVLEEMGRE